MLATEIQTYKHIAFDVINPKPEDIDIEDIAHALSNSCRFCGHTNEFYSVAQHSVLISERCKPENALWALLHDASEAYIADISRPLKYSGKLDEYFEIERKVMNAIMAKFNLPPPETFDPLNMPSDVKEADDRILQTEARDLMAPLIDDWKVAEPYPEKIQAWHPRVARINFLNRFKELTGDNDGRERFQLQRSGIKQIVKRDIRVEKREGIQNAS